MHRCIESFQSWLSANSVRVNSSIVAIQDKDPEAATSYWGVVATDDISKDTTLAWIPLSAVLCPRNSILRSIFTDEEISSGLALVITVAYERSIGSASTWAGYFASMPKREYIPVFWPDDELEALRPTPLFDAIQQDKEFLKEDFESVVEPLMEKYPDIFKKLCLSFDDFKNASSLVSSRDFYVDKDHGSALVPFADIFNHKSSIIETDQCHVLQRESLFSDDDETESQPRANLSEADDRQGLDFMVCNEKDENGVAGLLIKASHSLTKGQEIYNTYGELSNEELFMMYGFCLTDNIFNYVSLDSHLFLTEIERALVSDGMNVKPQLEYLKEAAKEEELSVIRMYPDTECCSSLASFLKILFSSEGSFPNCTVEGDPDNVKMSCPKMNSEEKKVLSSVLQRFKEHYANGKQLTEILFQSSKDILSQWIQVLNQTSESESEDPVTSISARELNNNKNSNNDVSMSSLQGTRHLKRNKFRQIWSLID